MMSLAFAENQRSEIREMQVSGSLSSIRRGDARNETLLAHALRSRNSSPLASNPDTLYHKGNKEGDLDASTSETHALTTLRALRQKVGAKAFAEWGLGILDSLQSPEVLRQTLHGTGIRRAARKSGMFVDDSTLSRPEAMPTGAMLKLWKEGPDGCSPQGQQLAQQLAREFGKTLPIMSYRASPQIGVRRLTPVEAERLQGFPDGWTAMHKDTVRYRQLGNAVAVPVAEWIGRRIVEFEREKQQ